MKAVHKNCCCPQPQSRPLLELVTKIGRRRLRKNVALRSMSCQLPNFPLRITRKNLKIYLLKIFENMKILTRQSLALRRELGRNKEGEVNPNFYQLLVSVQLLSVGKHGFYLFVFPHLRTSYFPHKPGHYSFLLFLSYPSVF